MNLTFATRPSALARWQTEHIAQKLRIHWPELTCQQVVITTKGDRVIDKPLPEIGGKGLFTQELEAALRAERVDAAVHSLKDLPTEDAPGLVVGVIPARASAGDVFICPAGYTLDQLPAGASVGTSSQRRRAQILARRPDLRVEPIRGNVETRLRKVREGQYDAVVLAAAGIIRLGLDDQVTHHLSTDVMLPAPGQGALAVQCRADDAETLGLLRVLDHPPTRLAVTAERSFLHTLGGGCSLPVGAIANVDGARIRLRAVVASLDGGRSIHVRGRGEDPYRLGEDLARQAIQKGARELLP